MSLPSTDFGHIHEATHSQEVFQAPWTVQEGSALERVWNHLFPHNKVSFLMETVSKEPYRQKFLTTCGSLGVKLKINNFEITLKINSVFPKASH